MSEMSWQIVDLRQNQFDGKDPQNPEALYNCDIEVHGSFCPFSLSLCYADIALLLQLYEVATVSRLFGKVFQTPDGYNDYSSALNYLITVAKNKGVYSPPKAETLYEIAARSLSAFTLPDFHLVDRQTIINAFTELYENPDLLEAFIQRITAISHGLVTVVLADINDFNLKIRHGDLKGLLLVRSNQHKRLIFGKFYTPFMFDTEEKL